VAVNHAGAWKPAKTLGAVSALYDIVRVDVGATSLGGRIKAPLSESEGGWDE